MKGLCLVNCYWDWLKKQLQAQHMKMDILFKTGGRGPVIILFGGDYQLPAIGDSGATYIPKINKRTNSKWMNDMTQSQSALQFLSISEEVMDLDQIVRQAEDIFSNQLWKDCAKVGYRNKMNHTQE
jgi:hypothetical protein